MKYDWAALYGEIRGCRKCGLCEMRTNVVIGDGDPHARLMIVGEGPGRDEDLRGVPFVGAAGQLLDKMLAAVSLTRKDVYIANVVKCRPPQNRVPTEEEATACLPYLRAQYALVRPAIIVCMGATAARHLIDPQLRITRDRGVWHERQRVHLIATYHPAALLRDASKKPQAWSDLQSIRRKYDELCESEKHLN
ncbi:MAG: uracil-DNA glycosylase [Clostridia bacterium]|nr:uracil-DNA glycosylase [Clostridia bacterium]